MEKKLSTRAMIEAVYEKICKSVSNPFSGQVNQEAKPEEKLRLIPQINAIATPGKEYKKIEGIIPDGYHIEYDDANNEEVLYKTCAPLGG